MGRRHLIFNQIGSRGLNPQGSGVVNQYTASGHTLNVYAPTWMAPDGITRYGHDGVGADDCTAAGPFGAYT